MRLQKQDIKHFPFQEYKGLGSEALELLAQEHKLTNLNSWMLPQILAHYGSWDLVWNNGKVDSNATAKKNITSDWHLGLWQVCTKLKRGSLVKIQSSPIGVNYSSLVPLILAGVKRHQDVKYMQWDIKPDSKLVHKELLEAMFVDKFYCDLGSERLMDIRRQGLMVKSGAKMGSYSPAVSKWALTGIQDTELHEVPKLAATILTQIWVADPSLRTNLMVLDLQDWDLMPKPLIEQDIFIHESNKSVHSTAEVFDLPWN